MMRSKDFRPVPDDNMIWFDYPHGYMILNQQWMETGPKAVIRKIMVSIEKAKKEERK